MRRTLSIALACLAVSSAFAQPYGAPNTPNGARPGNIPGTGNSLPRSNAASNIGPGDTGSVIAPTLPSPDVSPDAPARRFLLAARQAIAAGRTGQAQESLERAESRLLDRSVPRPAASQPDQAPPITLIAEARRALASQDGQAALRAIDGALQTLAAR